MHVWGAGVMRFVIGVHLAYINAELAHGAVLAAGRLLPSGSPAEGSEERSRLGRVDVRKADRGANYTSMGLTLYHNFIQLYGLLELGEPED